VLLPEAPKNLSVQQTETANAELARRIGRIGTAGLLKAGRLRAEGDHSGAWELLKAAARASRHIAWAAPTARGRSHGIMLAQYARHPVDEWARDEATTVPMLRQALDDLAAAEALTPPLSIFYRREYLLALESLTQPKPRFASEPRQAANLAQRPFFANLTTLDAFIHAEPERSRRVMRELIASVAVSLFYKEMGRWPTSPAAALKRFRPGPDDAPDRDQTTPLP
jgi:hypothetical protein